MKASAIIAEDEPLLAQALQSELLLLWPELQVLHTAYQGRDALEQILLQKPDMVFLDIHMPELSGFEVVADLLDAWPLQQSPFPLVVFVTAYDAYALAAFEVQAIDYVLKPWTRARLRQTLVRLQTQMGMRQAQSPVSWDALAAKLVPLLQANVPSHSGGPVTKPILQTIAASQGQTTHYVPVEQVLAFQAADKYVRVITAEAEYLIRTALKELLPQLPRPEFSSIHRGTVIQMRALDKVVRDDNGRLHAHLHGLKETFGISRLFAAQFKAM